jgi:hypothetical protein
VRIYSDQDLRELLEAALDPRTPEIDRRNAVSMLRTHLPEVLEGPPDGAEPDRASEFERSRRAALEGAEEVTPNETR